MTQPSNNPGQVPPAPNVGDIQNGYQWNGQQWVPAGPQNPPGKPWYKKWWVWVIIVIVLAMIGNAISGDDSDTAAPASAPTSETAVVETTAVSEPTTEAAAPETTAVEAPSEAPAAVVETTEATVPDPAPVETTEIAVVEEPASPYGEYPADQAAFVTGVDAARVAYEEGETELQRSKAISDRDKVLIGTMGGPNMTNWVGVIDNVGANGEGKAHVTIKISDDIKVKTWNNAFSDMLDNTLIPETDPVYDALLTLKPGDKVTFSGAFVSSDGATLYATNMTDVFSALTPEFLFKFTAVAPA